MGVSMDASGNSELASQGFAFPVAVVIGYALAVWSGVAAPLTPSVDSWFPRSARRHRKRRGGPSRQISPGFENSTVI